MFFRNLTLFRFPASVSFDDLESQLAEAALKPVGPMELSSRGFVSPFGRAGGDEAALMHRIDDAIWLTVGGEDKLLPSSVVNDLLQKKIDEYEEKNARRPGGKMRRQMKDDLVMELLPRAFVRPVRTDALVDTTHGVITAAGGLDRNRGGAEHLRRYWTIGRGAAKIRWNAACAPKECN